MPLLIEATAPGGAVARTPVVGAQLRLLPQPGHRYRIVDDQGPLPRDAIVRRFEDSLFVEGLPGDKVVVLDGFFTRCAPQDGCALSMDTIAGAGTADLTPASAPIAALQDGSFVFHTSGAMPATVATPPEAETSMRPLAAGLGVLLLAGAGAGGGGGGGGSSSAPSSAATVRSPTLTGAKQVDDPTPVITGTADPGARITLTVRDASGAAVGTFVTTTGADGNWSIDTGAGGLPASGLAEGGYTLLVQASNGTTNSALVSDALLVDLTPPAAPTIAVVAGDDRISAAEAAAGVTVRGTAEAGSSLAVSWGATRLSTTATADGAWSVVFAAAQIPASGGAVTAIATDAVGNASAPATHAVSLEQVGPAAPTISTVAGDDRVNAAEAAAGVSVGGTAGAGATVSVAWGGTTKTGVADGAGNWSVAFAGAQVPADGNATVSATVADGFGGTSAPATRVVLVDRVRPGSPTIATVAGNDAVNAAEANAGVTVSGTAEAGATLTVGWGTASHVVTASGSGAWSSLFSAAEIPGTNGSISAVAADAAGNASAAVTRAVSVDRAAPATPTIATVAGNDIVNLAEATAGITVTGTAEAGSTLTITWGSATHTATASGAGSWSSAFTAAEIPGNGASAVQASARDAAGNASAATSHAVTIDKTAPTATVSIRDVLDDSVSPVASVSNNGNTRDTTPTVRVTLSGTLGSGETVHVYGAGVDLGAATLNGDGTYRLTDSAARRTDEVYTARVVDAAGNLGLLSGSYTIHVI